MKGKMTKILLGFIIYILIFSSLPYIKQDKVSEEYKKNFDTEKFYKKDGSIAYADIISDNEKSKIEKIRAIDNAKDRILIGNYRFLLDDSGKILMASLIKAAKRGVDIDIILDGNTLFMNAGKNNYYLALASFPNVNINIYNPMNPIKPWSLMGRMHDKYMIVDNNIAFLGGRNIADRFFKSEGDFTYDWDVLVFYERRSPSDALASLEAYFYNIFNNGKRNKSIEDAAFFANTRKNDRILKELESIYKNDKSLNPHNYKAIDYENELIKVGNITLLSNPINIYSKEPILFYEMTELMKSADKDVHIHTPYVIGNKYMFTSLEDISTNAPTILFTNSPSTGANTAGIGDYILHEKKLRNMDLDILENKKTNSYHGKAFVIDDDISAIGSFNWDMRSMYIDTELMMVIEGKEFNKKLRNDFDYFEKDAYSLLSNGDRIDSNGNKIKQKGFLKRLVALIFAILFYPLRFLF